MWYHLKPSWAYKLHPDKHIYKRVVNLCTFFYKLAGDWVADNDRLSFVWECNHFSDSEFFFFFFIFVGSPRPGHSLPLSLALRMESSHAVACPHTFLLILKYLPGLLNRSLVGEKKKGQLLRLIFLATKQSLSAHLGGCSAEFTVFV